MTIPPAEVAVGPWVAFANYEDVPKGARVLVIKGDLLGTVWVHPDDVPDPDADLIDDVARSLREALARDQQVAIAETLPTDVLVQVARARGCRVISTPPATWAPPIGVGGFDPDSPLDPSDGG